MARLHAVYHHQRQRRGCVGCTNLREGHPHSGDDQVRRERTRAAPSGGGRSRSGRDAAEKQAARKKFVLPLLQPLPHCGYHHRSGSCGNDLDGCEHQSEAEAADGNNVERMLGEHVARVQRNPKSFKDEPWYKSPAGDGSSASVVLAALKQLDTRGSGFLRCHEVVKALQTSSFGLKEHEVRSLIAAYDSALRDDSAINYAAFAKKLKFPPPHAHGQNEEDARAQSDSVFRHQSYVEKIREHAQQLAERSSPQQQQHHGSSELNTKQRQLKCSPHAKFVPVSITKSARNDEIYTSSSGGDSGVVEMLMGSNNAFTALPVIQTPQKRAANANAAPMWLGGGGAGREEDVDRLSFEFDKKRRENRTSAKTSILLAHISRIEAFAKQEQQVTEQHETLRIAAKAMHRHEHYARLLEEEKQHIRVVEKQCKGLVKSDLMRMNRSVSKDSMFYVEQPPLS